MTANSVLRPGGGVEAETELDQLRRQLAQAAQLQARQNRYRLILDSSVHYAVIVLDLDGLVLEWNEGARRVLGWTEAEMLGRSASIFFVEEDRRAGLPQSEMSTALREERGIDECWHQRKDGSRFWANGEMMPLKDVTGAVQGFIKILRDRTEQHLASEKNRADAEFLRSVLASSSDCIKVLDLDARLRFMSEGGQQVMEVSDFNAIVGCPWPNFWEGQGHNDAIAAVAAARAGGVGHFRGLADTMAGTAKWWDVRVTPIFGADGRPEKLLSVSRDITETHDAETSLRSSEEHWRGLFQRLQEGLITAELVRDGEGRIVDWRYLDVNQAWSKMLGLERGQVVGRTVREIFPDIQEAWIDDPADVVGSGEPMMFTRQAAALGRWYKGGIYRIGPEHFTIIFQEVTERHLAEQSRAVLLALSDSLRGEGDPAALALAGCEVIGRALGAVRMGYAAVSSESSDVIIETEWTADEFCSLASNYRISDYGLFAEQLKRGDIVVVSDTQNDPRTAATSSKMEELSIRALINLPVIEHGRLAAMIYVNARQPRVWTERELALVQDSAERLRQAVERRRAEQDLQALATSLEQQVTARTRERDLMWNTSPDLLLVIDFNGVFRQVNPTWTVLLGYAADELIGHHVNEFVLPSDHDDTIGAYELAAHGGVPRMVNRYRHKDGSTRWISWVAAPASGMTYATGRDITAEKRREAELALAQDALRQSQKMEAVGQLTGGLAHDFNNLLTGVSGSLELMQTRIAQGRINDVGRYINAAQGAAKRAAALTHRLLAFSRRQTLDPKSTHVNQLIGGMEELIQRTVGPEITVETVGAAGLWPTLVDPGQLENALLNLCINARDAMPDGGKIMIETANRWLDERTARERDLPAGQYVSMCVSDTGMGMTPDVISKAFDPFFTTKPIGMGTGLGLSMVYGFCKQSSGQVRIYSEVGQGTVVCIYLPRYLGTEVALDSLPEVSTLPRAETGQTVLIVDDEPTVRMLVSEVLCDLGYVALEAADGAEGLKVLRSDARIDLLVTDVGLPGGLNGRQVADAARIVRPKLKILFITGYAENAVISHGHLDPGMHVLTKPFALEVLASRIKDLISD